MDNPSANKCQNPDADAGIFYNDLIGCQSKSRVQKGDADARKGRVPYIINIRDKLAFEGRQTEKVEILLMAERKLILRRCQREKVIGTRGQGGLSKIS